MSSRGHRWRALRACRELGQSLGEHRHDEAGLRFLLADLLEAETLMKTQ
jgi:hypothetical protein